jgi:hypothetical protein
MLIRVCIPFRVPTVSRAYTENGDDTTILVIYTEILFIIRLWVRLIANLLYFPCALEKLQSLVCFCLWYLKININYEPYLDSRQVIGVEFREKRSTSHTVQTIFRSPGWPIFNLSIVYLHKRSIWPHDFSVDPERN